MDVRVVGDGADADCTTIQDAHDDLPESAPEEGYGSGLIVVDGTYDSAREEFPIHVTKYLDIRGRSRTRSVVTCDDDADVFYFERLEEGRHGPPTRNMRMTLSNLTLRGGRDAVVLDGVTRFSGSYLLVDGPARDGLSAVRRNSQGSLSGGYLERVDVHGAGRNGFSLPAETNPHGYVLLRCSANHAGDVGAYLGGFTINVLGGAYQYCGTTGIQLEAHEFGAGAIGLHNAYFEYNGHSVSRPREIVLGDNVRGAKVHNCYITGYNEDRYDVEAENHAAIESRDNADCEVDHCTFRGYHWCDESGLFDVSDDSTNIELNLGSHHRFHGAEEADTFLRRPETFYTNGVRRGDDPTDEAGRYDGEFAYADGVPYVWSAGEEEWKAMVASP